MIEFDGTFDPRSADTQPTSDIHSSDSVFHLLNGVAFREVVVGKEVDAVQKTRKAWSLVDELCKVCIGV